MDRERTKTQFRDSQVKANPSLVISNLFSVKGKVALVTGGYRGVGLMIAKAFVQNGAKVYISARNADACDKMAEELSNLGPGWCKSIPANLNSDEACRALASKLAEQENKLHILVNNAGVTWLSSFKKFPDSAWGQIMTLNVASVFNLTRACHELLKKGSGGSMDPSHVITIGSFAGFPSSHVHDRGPSYAASKAAAAQITRWLAAKFYRDGIVANCLQPAVFPSDMTSNYMLKTKQTEDMVKNFHALGRIGHESDMAGLALFLSSKASAFITGETICLDGGSSHIRGFETLPPPRAKL